MSRRIIELSAGVARLPQHRLPSPADFYLDEGENIAIVGPNGSGKTLLVDMIRSAHPLCSGTLKFDFGEGASSYVSDNIRYIAFRDSYGGDTDRSYYMQQRWNSTDITDERILLSSGELRKYTLEKSLSSDARVLIVDNPFIGLDAPSREVFALRLASLAKSGMSIILVLTDAEKIPDFITRVVRMPQPVHQCDEDRLEVIRMNKVTIRYGERTILKDLDWVVRQGQRWRLTGCNGSGKSTLLSLVCADNPQSYACDISLFGRRRGTGESIWDIKKNIGYVSPELHRSFRSDASALRIVASGLRDIVGLYVQPKDAELQVSMNCMQAFGLDHLAQRAFNSLSSGEQRLVLLARAFVKDPSLLILDEPYHGLDLQNTEKVRRMIDGFCSRPEKTLIMVSHYSEHFSDVFTHELHLERH